MIALLMFLHILGFVLWIGGAYATMIASLASRREARSALGPLVRFQAAIAGAAIGPGAGLTVITGLILAFRMYGPDATAPGAWVMVMQVSGLLAAILTLAISIPTIGRLRRLDPLGEHAAYFDHLRARQKVVGMSSAGLGLLALVAGTLARFGG